MWHKVVLPQLRKTPLSYKTNGNAAIDQMMLSQVYSRPDEVDQAAKEVDQDTVVGDVEALARYQGCRMKSSLQVAVQASSVLFLFVELDGPFKLGET
jgi:hypothetical protein